jgi:lipoprotein-anchoring transpeptidase ErfK/SrfK
MKSNLTRRDFLKLTGLGLGALAFTPFRPGLTEFDDLPLIRIATTSVSVYKEPNDQSAIVATWYRDDVLSMYEEVNSGTPDYNPVWYRVWGGYMHRARIQKVKVIYNAPAYSLPKEGKQIAEVTVPYTQSLKLIENPQTKARTWESLYRLYYGTTHWVVGMDTGPDGQVWYKLLDELLEVHYYVPAIHLRLIPPEELSPLSPDVPWEQKRIEVALNTQTLRAYEYDQVVLETNISSGLVNGKPGANGIPTRTPSGEFNIEVKMPSKHMGDGNLAADIEAYELPGVPWVSFFTDKGHAFHGTYWHDNFGVPMSHGCVNMRIAEAKWIWRWSYPIANISAEDTKGYGTRVIITA